MANSLYDDEIFDADLENLFSNENFYANPMSTKIYLNISGSDKEEDKELVGNAVVANIEETNEKIPVYSYNSSIYKKYLQGKRIITGIIALRKVTVASFLSLLKRNKVEKDFEEKSQEIINQVNELKKIKDENNLKPIGLINMLESQLETLNKQKKEEIEQTEFYINGSSEILEKDNLLYYIENNLNDNKIGGNTAKISIEFKGLSENRCPSIRIKDVLFIKKQTEINIDKTDVFEVYSFMGNPDL